MPEIIFWEIDKNLKPPLPPIDRAQELLEEALRIDAQAISALRVLHQTQSYFVDDDSTALLQDTADNAFNPLSLRFSGLCAIDMDGWPDDTTRLAIAHSHNTMSLPQFNTAASIRGFSFLMNHPELFFQILAIDPGSSEARFNALGSPLQDQFLMDVADRFGSGYWPRREKIPDAYFAVITEPRSLSYQVRSLVPHPLAIPGRWSVGLGTSF